MLLVPVAFVVAGTAPRKGAYPLVAEAVLWHVACCGMIVVFGRLLLDLLEFLRCGRRMRIRGRYFLKLLSVWPATACFVMAILKTIGVA